MNTGQGRNILFSGVGGQGVLLISELVARTAIRAGFDAKKTEVHGAAQRGGSVVSHVRYAPKVYSPLIPAGEADILVSLEKLEGLRWAHYVRAGGTITLNTEERVPASIDGKPVEYPKEIAPFLAGKGFIVRSIDAQAIAIELGNYRAANIVLLGTIADETGIHKDAWTDTMKATLPSRFIDLNLAAFERGMEAAAGPVPARGAGATR
ncbi:MAG TPA: indolepyruvate oxidoreductase subunit beta [Bacteroidota bacterium]|nr:indolepyruvate oxidoreductase subunit beta [Bacteroidota bacterium]